MSKSLTPEQSQIARQAERLTAECKAHRLATVGSTIPEGWDRVVERIYPSIWPPYRVALPAGWIDLVLAMSHQLAELCPDAVVQDSKEKFAGLRLTITPFTEESMLLEMLYELMSQKVCQDCGEPGVPRSDRGWWATLCDKHEIERDQH